MLTLPPLRDLALWLQGQPYDTVVGQGLHCLQCPLARWLRQTLSADKVFVDTGTIQVCADGLAPGVETLPTPDAYVRFIEAIDLGAPGSDVTVAQAREALMAVLRDLGEPPVRPHWEKEGGAPLCP